jgi:hypothetical protein
MSSLPDLIRQSIFLQEDGYAGQARVLTETDNRDEAVSGAGL